MAEQQTIDQLVGLAVAMLGVAPGTDWLNARAKQIDAGATVDDIANEIQSSTGFEARYPAFRSNERFAKDFLEALLGDNVTDAIMMAAQDHVTGRLKAGETRGEVAAFLVEALTVVAADEDNAFYADFGKAATAFHNKVMVAKHYTEEALKASPDDKVLEGVTDDPATVETAINNINNPPQPPAEPETGQRIVLTQGIDNFTGGNLDDTFVAQPVLGSEGGSIPTLSPFDSIDGGGGTDTIRIFGVRADSELRLGAEDITNVENVVINTVSGINADLSAWTGLETVTLDRFGRDNETKVDITVDGAAVNSDRTFEGDVTIAGASGAVDIEAGAGSAVHIGSAGHTGMVMVKGGASVTVNNGAESGNKHSKTVTSVRVDGVRPAASTKEMVDGFKAKTDTSGFLVDQAGLRQVTVVIDDAGPDQTINSIKLGDESEGLRPLLDADGDAIEVVLAAADGEAPADEEPLVFDTTTGLVRLEDGRALPSEITVTFTPEEGPGKDATETEVTTPGTGATLTVHSNAIETVAIHNSTAVALVSNNSKMADGKDMPEDLAVTVNKYGTFQPWGAVKVAGKLSVGGAGSAENIDIAVAAASAFDLASGKVKTLDISGEGRLVLGVNNFEEDDDASDDGVSETLESVTVTGAVGVEMSRLSGMRELKMIDASGSSGTNHFRSQKERAPADADQLRALEMVKGGSGRDIFTLRTSVTGKLEDVHTGDGNDTVTITGMLRNGGIEVDLGAGDDTYSGRASNGKSRIEGGEGTDTLHLTSTANSTYKDADGETLSIYTGFETLNVARGSGDYDIEQLGIENDVLVTASTMGGIVATAAGVTLENMADGMGIRVHGVQGRGSAPNASTDTKAKIEHELADDPRASEELDVVLAAFGRNDTGGRNVKTEGEAELDLTTGDEIEVINITSNATPHSADDTPASQRARASDYLNEITLTSDSVERLVIDGNAKLEIKGDTSDALNRVDARDNTGGVTFTAGTEFDEDLELVGGSGVDVLAGGAGDDEISGGLGGDRLTGGGGNDEFKINSAEESMARFAFFGGVNTLLGGYDTIVGFVLDGDDSSGDKLDLSRGLLRDVSGKIKNTATEWDDWMFDNQGTAADTDDDTFVVQIGSEGEAAARTSTVKTDADPQSAENLAAFIGTGDGLFESRDALADDDQTSDVGGDSANMVTTKYSIAVINQNDGTDERTMAEGIWLLFDIDGNGDYDAGTDMVIFLEGTSFSEDAWNSGGNGAGIFI